jgi:hypothetical protein
LLFFELQNKSYDFTKIWIKSDSKTSLKSVLVQIGPRGVTVLAGTASFGLRTEAVGSKEIWTHGIKKYRFD